MAAFEVLALDTATPQIRAPGAGDTYTFPRQALFLAGTVSAPGIAQTSNDNTGMWWPAANTLAWSINGAEGMRLNSTGLGIGTSNPGVRLDVESSGNSAVTVARIRNTTAGTAAATRFFIGNDASAGAAFIAMTANANSTNPNTLTISNEISDSSSKIIFNTQGTERMRLDASGNLGLGVTPAAWTTASSTKAIEVGDYFLKLAGSSAFGGAVTNNAYYDGAWKRSQANLPSMYTQLGGVHSWHTAPSGAAGSTISFTQAMTLDASGRLGIGVTSPSYKLDVSGTSGTIGIAARGTYASGDVGFYFAPSAVTGSVSAVNGFASVSQDLSISVQNQNSTDATASAKIRASVNGASVGDAVAQFTVSGITDWTIGVDNSDGDRFKVSSSATLGTSDRFIADTSGNVVVGNAAIATNATDGFLYVPTCAGTPTGTPTTYTGRSPIVVDTTNNKLYFYSGGQWRDAGP